MIFLGSDMPLSDYLEGKHWRRENIKTARLNVWDRRSYCLKNKIPTEREISAHICEACFPGPSQPFTSWVISNAIHLLVSHLLKHSCDAKKSHLIQNLKGLV